jgi:hypothetical protein
VLTAIQEEWARQNSGNRASNSRFETTFFHAIVVIREKLVHILIRNRTAVCAFGCKCDDLFGAGLRSLAFAGIRRRLANENRSRLGVIPSPFALNGP